MVGPAARAAWASSALVITTLVALGTEIPQPTGFWPLTVAGWVGLVVASAAALGVVRLLVWPATSAQLRRALKEEETRGTIIGIVRDGFREELNDDDEWKEKVHSSVDVHTDRLLMAENAIMQQGKMIQELPGLVASLQRIEMQMEMQTEAMRAFAAKAEKIDEMKGRLDEWDRSERRRLPR